MDAETFQNLMRESKDRVFSHALYILQCQEDAEDVTQEVFVRLWNHRHRIRGGSTEAWIMRTAHHLCIDLLRRRRTCAFRLRRWRGIDMDTFAAKADGNTDPQEHYELDRRQQALLSAMEMLPSAARSMLLLHYFHGFKYGEIAEILEVKAGTVKVAVHRARKALRKLLAESPLESTGRRVYEEAVRES